MRVPTGADQNGGARRGGGPAELCIRLGANVRCAPCAKCNAGPYERALRKDAPSGTWLLPAGIPHFSCASGIPVSRFIRLQGFRACLWCAILAAMFYPAG